MDFLILKCFPIHLFIAPDTSIHIEKKYNLIFLIYFLIFSKLFENSPVLLINNQIDTFSLQSIFLSQASTQNTNHHHYAVMH